MRVPAETHLIFYTISGQLYLRHPCRLADRQLRSTIALAVDIPLHDDLPVVYWIILLGSRRRRRQAGFDSHFHLPLHGFLQCWRRSRR